MSIREELLVAISERQLVRLTPRVKTDKEYRAIYLMADLYKEINEVSQDERGERFAQLRADLENFAISEHIDSSYLKLLDPPGKGVFEIRSVRPRPSIRVFGMFAETDTFVATHLVERAKLGGWGAFEWKDEIRKCRQYWRQVFPRHDARTVSKDEISQLVSGMIYV